MDKYEFNIRAEQLRKHVRNGEYEAAMKIADTIDWRRVNNISLLSMVSEVYEKNRDYAEAKEILLLAYDKAPAGKRLLYKLVILSLKENDISEAERYYKDFYDVGQDDPRHYILRYLILKAKGAPLDQQINSLEAYNRTELDEMWMYELAELYYQAGRYEECVEICDNIMLMFGIGSYVDKAIDLKKNRIGCELTPYQESLVANRDKYEENLRSVRAEYIEEEEDMAGISAQVSKMAGTGSEHGEDAGATIVYDSIREPLTAAAAACGHTATASVCAAADAFNAPAKEKTDASPEPKATDRPDREQDNKTAYTVNFIVERRTPRAGLDAAVRLLKLMHEHTGSTNQVTKIRAEKLNERGIFASADKIAGKDLIIEEAGDMTYARIEEIIQLIRREPAERVVILIDNPMQLKKIIGAYPELLELFHLDKEDNTAVPSAKASAACKTVGQTKEAEEKTGSRDAEPVMPTDIENEEICEGGQGDTMAEGPEAGTQTEKQEPREEEMDIDEFAAYAGEYAKSIDCSISGKSLLALYERIELMEEEGIPLTKENAVDLIEEAADKAEKKTLGSLFVQKWDKNDKLILKEEHFI